MREAGGAVRPQERAPAAPRPGKRALGPAIQSGMGGSCGGGDCQLAGQQEIRRGREPCQRRRSSDPAPLPLRLPGRCERTPPGGRNGLDGISAGGPRLPRQDRRRRRRRFRRPPAPPGWPGRWTLHDAGRRESRRPFGREEDEGGYRPSTLSRSSAAWAAMTRGRSHRWLQQCPFLVPFGV